MDDVSVASRIINHDKDDVIFPSIKGYEWPYEKVGSVRMHGHTAIVVQKVIENEATHSNTFATSLLIVA